MASGRGVNEHATGRRLSLTIETPTRGIPPDQSASLRRAL
jgi:hypothetical protein